MLGTVREVLHDELSNLFSQTEALIGLYVDLKLDKSLPPTRGWAGSPDFLKIVADHALKAHPKVIVECGSGVSTIILARCLELNGEGHVYSLEHDPQFAAKTRNELERHDLNSWASVLYSPLQPCELDGRPWTWYSLDHLPDLTIQMLVVDGPPEYVGQLARYPAGPLLFSCLDSGAVVFLDDLIREDEGQVLNKWTREFPDFVAEIRTCEKECGILRKSSENLRRR